MLTDQEIDEAKQRCRYSLTDKAFHEHNDCIRLAYEWLDAQPKLTKPNTRTSNAVKHIIEKWAGRYVSQTDVDVAAAMHPEITGKYPYFNISSKLVRPNERRFEGIGEAGKHPGYREKQTTDVYGTRLEP